MKRRRSGKPKVQSGLSKPPEVEMNPMLMFEVLSHLFTVIAFNFEDFQNFRLVCKEWFRASFGRWREEVQLEIFDAQPAEYYEDEEEEGDADYSAWKKSLLYLDDILALMNTPGDPHQFLSDTNHFRRFKVEFSYDLCFDTPRRLEFWSKIGPKMTHLEISHSNISSAEDFARILFEMTPNLTCLKYQSCDEPETEIPYPFDEPDGEFLRIPVWEERLRPEETSVQKKLTDVHLDLYNNNFNLSWVYFLARLPNLKKLTVEALGDITWIWGEADASEQQVFLQSFQIVREKLGLQYFSQLEELNLMNMETRAVGKLPPFLLPTLRDLNFPLRSLSLDIGYSSNFQSFKQLLEMYSNTLEKLVVCRAPHCAPFPYDFPYGVDMPHLKELRFIGSIVKNLKFLRNVQNLKKIEITTKFFKVKACLEVRPEVDVVGNTKFSSGPLKNLVLNQLELFYVESERTICSAERVKALGKLFPNLKTLCIGLKDDGFSMVCKTWEKIENFCVVPNELTEKGILGKQGRQNYQEPNITDLKKLKWFRMGVPLKNSTKGRLTTNSILHGLLLCPNLEEVSLGVAPQASQLAQERLASKCFIDHRYE